MTEIVGFTLDQLATDIEALEQYIAGGGALQLNICTEDIPTEADLASLVLNAEQAGFAMTFPEVSLQSGVPTTSFTLSGSTPRSNYLGAGIPTGQWQVLIPLLTPLATIGIIAYGITKVGDISKAIMPILLVAGGIMVVSIALLRRPAERYLERGGRVPYLPSTVTLNNIPATVSGTKIKDIDIPSGDLKLSLPTAGIWLLLAYDDEIDHTTKVIKTWLISDVQDINNNFADGVPFSLLENAVKKVPQLEKVIFDQSIEMGKTEPFLIETNRKARKCRFTLNGEVKEVACYYMVKVVKARSSTVYGGRLNPKEYLPSVVDLPDCTPLLENLPATRQKRKYIYALTNFNSGYYFTPDFSYERQGTALDILAKAKRAGESTIQIWNDAQTGYWKQFGYKEAKQSISIAEAEKLLGVARKEEVDQGRDPDRPAITLVEYTPYKRIRNIKGLYFPATVQTEFQKAKEIWDKSGEKERERILIHIGYFPSERFFDWNELRQDRKIWIVDYFKEEHPGLFEGLTPSKKTATGYMTTNPPSPIEHNGLQYYVHMTFPTRMEAEEEAEGLRGSGSPSKILVKPWEGGYVVYEHPLTWDEEKEVFVPDTVHGWMKTPPLDFIEVEGVVYRRHINFPTRKEAEEAAAGLKHCKILIRPWEGGFVLYKYMSPAVRDFKPGEHTQNLIESVRDEKEAIAMYHDFADMADEMGDQTTADLYRHVAAEEEHHAEEFGQRLTELGGALKYEPVTAEFMAETIAVSGYKDKLDQAFQEAIQRARG